MELTALILYTSASPSRLSMAEVQTQSSTSISKITESVMNHLRNELIKVKVFQAKITTTLNGGTVYQEEIREIVIEAKKYVTGTIEEFQINRNMYVPVRILEKRAKQFIASIRPGEEISKNNLQRIQSLISEEEA